MRSMRKLLKYLLPYGVIEAARARREFGARGRRLRVDELWQSDRLLHHAEQTGLALLPPQHVAALKCIVDVGANVGQWSSMLLDCIRPERLIIIEPLPAAFAQLQRRFAHESEVELHNVAVGDSTGTVTFRVTRDTTGASALPPSDEMRALIGSNWTVESEIPVSMTTLDTLLRDPPEISLLKLDVQGFEKQVLAGATNVLEKTKFLLVELNFMPQYVGGSWFGDLHQTLTRDGKFYLANTTKPLILNGRASMCDGLYVNAARVPDFAQPDFL